MYLLLPHLTVGIELQGRKIKHCYYSQDVYSVFTVNLLKYILQDKIAQISEK